MSPFVSRPRHTGYVTPGCGAHLRFTGYGMDARPHLFRNLPLPPRLLHTPTHTHTRLMALFPGLPGWTGTRKVKPIWILLKQETVSGSGISWAICKSAPRSRQINTPAPHHSVFFQAGCPSCRPTNSVKTLKVTSPRLLHRYQITQLGDRGTSV